jgi:hypothetical protein
MKNAPHSFSAQGRETIANGDETDLQQAQPQVYDTLTRILTGPEQQVVQSVLDQAEANARAAAQAAQGAQQQAHQHLPPSGR